VAESWENRAGFGIIKLQSNLEPMFNFFKKKVSELSQQYVDKELAPLRADFDILDRRDKKVRVGNAVVVFSEHGISLELDNKEQLFFPLREILSFRIFDGSIRFDLLNQQAIDIRHLGNLRQDFLNKFAHEWNEVLLEEMYARQILHKTDLDAIFSLEQGEHRNKGRFFEQTLCQVRLYENCLVIMPQAERFLIFPYNTMIGISESEGKLVINLGLGDKLSIGRVDDDFKEKFLDILNNEIVKTQNDLAKMLPGLEDITIRKLAILMKGGKAAKKRDVDAASLKIWPMLEDKLKELGIGEQYEHLKKRAQDERIAIGLKMGTYSNPDKQYAWFLAPIYSLTPKDPGNTIALQTTSAKDKTETTYFFRIMDKHEYVDHFKRLEKIAHETDELIYKINRYMLAANFRKDLFYISDEDLDMPQYTRFKFIIKRMPELQELRFLYAGRILHTSREEWQLAVSDILEQNVAIIKEGEWDSSTDRM